MDAERPFAPTRMPTHGPGWDAIADVTRRAMRLTAELNKLSFDDVVKVREIFSELTGRTVDDTFTLIPLSTRRTAWISASVVGSSSTSAAHSMTWAALPSAISS